MNIEDTKKACEIILKAGKVPMLWGPPGVGKTTMFKQLALKHGVEFRSLTTNLLMLEHLTGIPINNGDKMVFSRPDNIPDTGKGFILIDEITDGMLSIQKMLYSLVLERTCNGHKLGENWKVAAAGNRPGDGSGSSMLPSALITRMVHIGVCCEVPDFTKVLPATAEMDSISWVTWAISENINPFIIAFIKSFPEKLYSFQAIPRTFEILSDILSVYNQPDFILQSIITGTIGPETGHDFFSFYKLAKVLPDLDSILNDPLAADLPGETGIIYALSTSLIYRADRSNFENIIQYASRFSEKELEIYLVNTIAEKDQNLKSLPGFIQWHNKNSQYLN